MKERKSSYLHYLPPILWQGESPSSSFSLGAMLMIFEKMLTGIDDDSTIDPNENIQPAIQTQIERLPELFNPWRTPPAFLNWLASWVDLELPATDIWDNYQQRQAIDQIVRVYRKRGLKAGLNQYLDLYTVARTRPRIAIDDGSTLLTAQVNNERLAPISTLLPGPSVYYTQDHKVALIEESLLSPTCIALAPDNSLLVGDLGTPPSTVPRIFPGIWHIKQYSVGKPEYAYQTEASARVQRLGSRSIFARPLALVVDPSDPWKLYILDDTSSTSNTTLYCFTSPNLSTPMHLATKAQLGLIWPLAMALDTTNGHLLMLDRGGSIFDHQPASPKFIDVDVQHLPVQATSYPLPKEYIREPLSLLVETNGDLIIGDAGIQTEPQAADLIRIQRTDVSDPDTWIYTSLLASLSETQNPLIAPLTVLRQHDSLLVLDLGLKPYVTALDPWHPETFLRHMAEPASIYRISMSGPTSITPVTEARQMVSPTAMILDSKQLYICDQGPYAYTETRTWRTSPQEFGIIVHFSRQRPTTQQQRRQIIQDIHSIVEQEKSAHSLYTIESLENAE